MLDGQIIPFMFHTNYFRLLISIQTLRSLSLSCSVVVLFMYCHFPSERKNLRSSLVSFTVLYQLVACSKIVLCITLLQWEFPSADLFDSSSQIFEEDESFSDVCFFSLSLCPFTLPLSQSFSNNFSYCCCCSIWG